MSLLLALTSSVTTFTLTADSGSFTLNGQAVTFVLGRSLVADSGSYALSGQSVNFAYCQSLAADNGSYSLTGQNASFVLARSFPAASASFSFAGQDASFVFTPSGATYTLSAGSGSFALSGQDAIFVKHAGRSKLYNPNLIDHPAWAHNSVKQEEVKPETEASQQETVELAPRETPHQAEVKTLETQLAALNIHVEKLQSYEKLFELEEALRIEQERIAQEDEDYAIALCIALLL
jgi:hypothetical protein